MKVLVDTLSLVFRDFNVAKTKAIKEKGEFLEKDIGLFYHFFLRDVNDLVKDYGKVIFCTEGRGSLNWRRSIYPPYKRNRDASKKEESYLLIKNEFDKIEEILALYPTKVISVEGAEADDTIYALSTHFADLGEDVLVVSADGDLTQLTLFNDKIKVYNPTKREISPPKPYILEYKAIVGDRTDGISGIPRLGEKTFHKMMLSESLFAEKISGHEEEYKKLLQIVDLRKYPKEYHIKALEEYNLREWNKFNPEDIEFFMYEKALVNHLEYWWDNVSLIHEALGDVERMSNVDFDVDLDLDNLLDMIKEGVV